MLAGGGREHLTKSLLPAPSGCVLSSRLRLVPRKPGVAPMACGDDLLAKLGF